jgi:ribosome-associated protein
MFRPAASANRPEKNDRGLRPVRFGVRLEHEKFDSGFFADDCATMKTKSTPQTRTVIVREVPIELCAFIKFGGLADSGGSAKQMIAEGSVLLNGVVETRKRKQLAAGDRVTVDGDTIVVRVG